MSRYRFQHHHQRNQIHTVASQEHSPSNQYHRSRTVPVSFNIPTRKEINALFKTCPEDNQVALLTPKPTQASDDPRYRYLLNSGTGETRSEDRGSVQRSFRDDSRKTSGSRSSSATSGSSSGTASSSSSIGGASSNSSRSSAGYTSSSSLALDDDEVKKMFTNANEGGCPNIPASPSTLSTSSLRSSTSSYSQYGSTPNTTPPESVAGPSSLPGSRAKFDIWMLNPGAVAFAGAFSENPEENEEDEQGADEEQLDMDMDVERSDEEDNDATPLARRLFDEETTDTSLPSQRRGNIVWKGELNVTSSGDLPLNAHVLPPPRPQATATPRHLRKPWHSLFEKGCQISAGAASVGVPAGAECSRTYATRLVESGDTEKWDDNSLENLVQAFVWKATLDNDDDQEKIGFMRLEGVAAFASKVRDALQELDSKLSKPKSEKLETIFVRKLRSMVMGTFVSCWHVHPDNRHAIVYELTSPNRTPQHLSHVKYSLRLCSFIGDLYQACLLSRLDTIGCVRILLFNMAMVEHLTGIENILKRAGPKLWKESMYASPSLGATSFASANSCNSPSELCWSILDWEVREFENQIRSARGRVQDNQFLLRDNEHNKIEGGVRRKVDGLIRYAWECCRFLREGYAGDGRYVAVGGWQPSISVDWRHSNFC